jgi:GNAT superfamily N-acetyltransferase
MTPSAPLLRPAEAKDRETLIGFLLGLNRHEATIQPDRRLDRVAAERCYEEMLAKVSERGGAVIIAEIGGEPAGFIAWHVEMDDAYIRDDLVRHADIAELYVAEPFRRQGLARVLLAKAERMIREAGLPRYFIGVLDGNDGAAAAYRQAGFKPYLSLLVKELD